MLMPPKIQGPVNELSTFVIVLGAKDSASVQLFADSSPVGSPVIASGLSVTVSLGGTALTAGQAVTATQSQKFLNSPPSPDEIVGAAPSTLPSLTFISPLHTCVDWVVISGMVVGAKASIILKGTVVGTAVASGSILSVPVKFTAGAVAGDVLDAIQSYSVPGKPGVKGPVTHSLPLAPGTAGEPPTPVITPPYECDLAVMVSGLLSGSSLRIMHDTKELAGYPYTGSPVWAELEKPLAGADTVRARQDLAGCRRQGGYSLPPTGILPFKTLPLATILGPICPSAPVLHMKDLRPGADVWVHAVKETNRGAIVKSELGYARAWGVDCEFPLPVNWADAPALNIGPGVTKFYIEVNESNCGRSTTATAPIEPLPSVVGTPEFHPAPIDCATLVVATGLIPGTLVMLHSDQPDFPQLSAPVSVSAATMVLYPYRPLRSPENIWISQGGCSVTGDSAHVEVQKLKDLNVPSLETPIRQPRGGVWFRDLLAGGTLYVFYNGVPSIVVSIASARMFVSIPGMKVEDHVWGVQKFCTQYSKESTHESVTFGEMKISQQPSPIQRSKVESVLFTAEDPDTKQAVAGNVRVGGSIVAPTGGVFSINVPLGSNGPPGQVEAVGYQSEGIAWSLTDPPPPPPPPSPKLHLALQNQSGGLFSISSVAWTIWHQAGGGFSTLPAATGISAVVTPPAKGQYLIHADVLAVRVATATNELSEFRGVVTGPGGATSIIVVWNGVDMTKTFKLVAESQSSTPGGPLDLYNPVIELIS